MKGKVLLVGAGPGDPGLFTLRGAEALREADVVVLDALAPEALLAHARPEAEVVRAGKRYGDHSMSQEELNALLVSLARSGKTVVRLKGGDPFVFARGGEECEALARAEIPFEIISGVTSAVAVPGAAGIPLTHRDYAKSFAVLTGHVGAAGAGIRWDALAKGADTLVLLMSVTRLGENARALLEAGRPPDTPVAIIEQGTTPRQRTTVGTLGTIAEVARRAGVKPPAVIVVGDVVRLRETLGGYEALPLFGKRVLITRPRAQASAVAERLQRLGAEPVALATIEIGPPKDGFAALDQAIAALGDYQFVVFTSQNGVRFFWERLDRAGGDARRLGGARLAAIGPGTAETLREHGLRADIQAKEFNAEGLARELLGAGVAGKRVLVPRAAKAREVLIDELRRAGAIVDVVPAYETTRSEESAAELRERLAAGTLDAVTFTSASTVESFCALIGADAARLLGPCVVACIGPVTRDAARAHGIECAVMPKDYTIPALCDALAAHFAEHR
jgi:uroporphyrinogen III methyltransferase/synthase